jgi:GWxTD domain-containing protein
MRSCVALAGLLFVIAPLAGAQPWQTDGELAFWVDAIPFKGIGDATGLQIVYRGGADQLTFRRDGDEYRAWVLFSLEMAGPEGLGASKRWATPVGARDEAETTNPGMYIVESLVADLPPGMVTVRTSVRDSLSGASGVAEGQVELPSYADSSLSVSGVIFASRVRKGGQGPFQKGGYDILPEPSRRFGPFQPILYVYHETYNVSCSDTGGAFAVQYTVSKPEGRVMKVLPTDTLGAPGTHAARVAGLSVAGLTPGPYVLRVGAEDLTTSEHAYEEMPFWVVESRATDAAEAARISDEAPVLSEEDAELLEALVHYLGTADEKTLYEGLSPGARTTFLTEFSRPRLTPALPTPDAYLDEQRRRFRHVNADYGGFRKGWKSDPGRVYIVYGPPDEVERYAAQTDRKDHQIWRYYSMGGTIFVFVDESGYGNYRLIHSTAKGELRNPDWQKQVFILPTW